MGSRWGIHSPLLMIDGDEVEARLEEGTKIARIADQRMSKKKCAHARLGETRPFIPSGRWVTGPVHESDVQSAEYVTFVYKARSRQ